MILTRIRGEGIIYGQEKGVDLLVEAPADAGVQRIYGVSGDSPKRHHRLDPPSEQDPVGSW
jgi:hypothetical protein